MGDARLRAAAPDLNIFMAAHRTSDGMSWTQPGAVDHAAVVVILINGNPSESEGEPDDGRRQLQEKASRGW